MEVIELQRMIHRDPPNLGIYYMLYSFTQGLFLIVVDKLWFMCSKHTKQSKLIFVGIMLLSQTPIAVMYLLKQLKNISRSIRIPSTICPKDLITPSIFRILLYAVVLIITQIARTYYFAVGFIINMVVGEVLFQINTIKAQSQLKQRTVGVVLISIGSLFAVTDTQYYINPNLYLIFLATIVFIVHGDTYINSKLLKLFKPNKNQLITKYFFVQVLIFSCSYFISVVLEQLGIINEGLTFKQFFKILSMEPTIFAFSVFWSIIFGTCLNFAYYTVLEVSSTAQHIYLLSMGMIWFQLYCLIHNFKWNLVVSIILGAIGMMFYLPALRPDKFIRFIYFMVKKDQPKIEDQPE